MEMETNQIVSCHLGTPCIIVLLHWSLRLFLKIKWLEFYMTINEAFIEIANLIISNRFG